MGKRQKNENRSKTSVAETSEPDWENEPARNPEFNGATPRDLAQGAPASEGRQPRPCGREGGEAETVVKFRPWVRLTPAGTSGLGVRGLRAGYQPDPIT